MLFFLHISKKSCTFAPAKVVNGRKIFMQNTEIERKFLVKNDSFLSRVTAQHEVVQGYLCKDSGRTIRVRISDEHAFITIKSDRLRDGLAKFEWEKEIEASAAKEMMRICLPTPIEKTRYIVPAPSYNGQPRKWEIDVFHGRLEGRVLAEIELGEENEPFDKPDWLGEEVTGLPQYYNANM